MNYKKIFPDQPSLDEANEKKAFPVKLDLPILID
tara:strand:+ start:397 stop:498 length:102 start_codon:yes stop_codon:yes gene_type:complete